MEELGQKLQNFLFRFNSFRLLVEMPTVVKELGWFKIAVVCLKLRLIISLVVVAWLVLDLSQLGSTPTRTRILICRPPLTQSPPIDTFASSIFPSSVCQQKHLWVALTWAIHVNWYQFCLYTWNSKSPGRWDWRVCAGMAAPYNNDL